MLELRALKAKMYDALPPAVVAFLRTSLRRKALVGRYRIWAEARAASKGYDDGAIFEKVLLATRTVVAGRAKWDRDGATFDTDEVNGPLVAALREIASESEGALDLVDFGGALGSSWRQHRLVLSDLASVRWRVVEQPHYVEAGREFADGVLDFFPTLKIALADGAASTVLFSSVLPYVEHPKTLLEEVVRCGVRHVIIDRTSFAGDHRERIVVQRAPAELGGGSYPCWLFNRENLLTPLAALYRLVCEWPGFDDVDRQAVYRGFHFVRK